MVGGATGAEDRAALGMAIRRGLGAEHPHEDVLGNGDQGKENVAMATARPDQAAGDVRAALTLIPLTKPIYARYREMVASKYPPRRVVRWTIVDVDNRCGAAVHLRAARKTPAG
jgi:hypothetical protein